MRKDNIMSKNKLDFINIKRIGHGYHEVRFNYKNRKNRTYKITSYRLTRFLDFINENGESFYIYAYVHNTNHDINLEIGRN